jgi:far upstream element-binding protein
MPQGPPAYPTATPPAMPGYGLPPAANSGAVDLSGIKPINSGSVSIQDALANARAVAAQKGLHSNPRPGSFDMQSYVTPQPTYNAAAYSEDPRLRGRDYRERSRSRSPPRRENMRDSYNPYREERRGGNNYGRERSNSPRRNQFSPPPQRAYGGGRSRSPPPNDNSEVILIDSSLVGLVIGRQGESLRRIEQESGTRIQFINGPNSGPSRECRITGSPSSRITAKREINRIIEENGGNPARETGHTPHQATRGPSQSEQPPMRAGEESSQIMVPDRTVGLIIGRGGETIRSLQERSKCHVNIVGENKSVNGLRPVNLIGTPEACAEAKDLIMEIVDSDTRAGEAGGAPAHQPQHQPRRDNFNAFGGGPGGGAGGERINDSIMVPSDAVGMIIGKGELSAVLLCKVNTNPL